MDLRGKQGMNSQASVRSTAVEILDSLADNYLDYEKKVHSMARQRSFSERDKSFLYKLVNGVIIYKKLLDFIIDLTYDKSIKQLERSALNLLRVGVFQKVMLDTPDHAFIYETVEAARKIGKKKLTGLVNGVLRNLPAEKEWKQELEHYDQAKQLAIKFSHPHWLVEKWLKTWGSENTEKLLKFDNTYTKIYFRHNALKISWPELKTRLDNDFEKVEYLSLKNVNLFSVEDPARVINSDIIRAGYALVQDYSQLFSVLLLNPEPDEKILDACAAPGGKTSLIAQLTDNKSAITASDISENRIDTLQQNLNKLGAIIEEVKIADAAVDDFEQYDRILLDVPCSGTGVIARNADLRWNRRSSDLIKYAEQQLKMLNNVAKHLKDRGQIVYSTCSIEPQENWGVVEDFLRNNQFEVLDARKFFDNKFCDDRGAVDIKPYLHGLTGSFAVRLEKNKI